MLRELRIENLLLIERAGLQLGSGLNVITGETGAGKTILAHSLDLLLGGRARSRIVRPGAAEAWVEGTFDLPAGFFADPDLAEIAARVPEDADELVLGRRVSAAGRTSAFVAGRSATAADLSLLGSRLLAFYGQHEHRRLTISSAQMEVLDGFAGPEHLKQRQLYRQAYREHALASRELEEVRERDGARERDLDLHRYELAEIEAAAPEVGEETELVAERERLRHGERLRTATTQAQAGLSGDEELAPSASVAVAEALAALRVAAGVDASLDAIAERLDHFAVELGDLASELRAYSERIEMDPGRLAVLEERLDALQRLQRKHGGSTESVLAHAERCRVEIDRLEHAEEHDAELEARRAEAATRRDQLGKGLTVGRARAAGALQKRVVQELEQLAMPGATLDVVLEPHPEGAGPSGVETVELLVAPNPGIEAAPLREAASGGELSRIMLALTRLAEGAGGRTLVFDEIDAGIGGGTAKVVGERLRSLGQGSQVVCITHLPQVASLASTHFRIEKDLAASAAKAEVERIEGDDLVAEITRMLGAERGDRTASRHARELLAAA